MNEDLNSEKRNCKPSSLRSIDRVKTVHRYCGLELPSIYIPPDRHKAIKVELPA